ncbi:MAG: tape measure protein, partial [Christensenella sp.]
MAYDGSLSFDTKVNTQGFQQGANKLTNIVQGLGIFKLLEKGFQMVGASVDKAMARIDTMEQFRRVMNTMTGSVDETSEALTKTTNIVTGTAYGLDVAAKSVQNFVSRGMEISRATETVEGWGNAVAFYGNGSNASFAAVTDALSKMQTKGNVTMEQMEMLLNAGVPAIEMYADAMGITAADVTKIMSDGKLSATDFIFTMNKAMASGTEKFPSLANAAKEAGSSWSASFDNMQAAITRGVQSIINSIDETNSAIGKPTMREGISAFGKAFEKVLKEIAKLIVPVVENLDIFAIAVAGVSAAIIAQSTINTWNTAMKVSTKILNLAKQSEVAYTLALQSNLGVKSLIIAKDQFHTVVIGKNALARATEAAAIKLNTTAEGENIVTRGASVGVVTLQTAIMGALSTATSIQAAVVGVATVTWQALTTAMLANPIGLIIVGIVALIAAVAAVVAAFSKGSKEFRKQKSDVENLSNAQKDLSDSIKASAASHDENIKAMSAEATSSKKLSENIVALSKQENKSANDKQKLAAYIKLLNEQQEGLNLTYDEESDHLSINADKLTEYVNAKNEIQKANSWLERQNELYKEEAIIQENLQVLTQKELELAAQLEAKTISQGEYNKLMKELNTTRQEYILGEEDIGARKVIVETELAKTNTASAQNIIANSDAAAAKQIADAEAVAVAEESEMQRRKDALTAYTDVATNMFDRIETESKVSVGEMISNLEHNQAALATWADNLVILGKRGIDEGLLQKLRDAGPESAATVSELVNSSDEQLTRLSEVFKSGSSAATEALMTELGLPMVTDSGSKMVDDISKGVKDNKLLTEATVKMVTDTKAAAEAQVSASKFDTVGEQMAAGITAGINKGASGVVSALVNAAISAYRAAKKELKINSPSALFRDMIGLQTMKGWALGVEKGAPEVLNNTLNTVSVIEKIATNSVLQAPKVQMQGFVSRMQGAIGAQQAQFSQRFTAMPEQATVP